jgi:hypothetical protein
MSGTLVACLADGHVESFTSAEASDPRHGIATYDGESLVTAQPPGGLPL